MYNIYDCEIDNQYLLKDQVIEYIRNAKEAVKTEEATNILERLEAAISLLPGADVAPVLYGTWEPCKDYDFETAKSFVSPDKRACTICGDIWCSNRQMRHCPSCGARIKGARQAASYNDLRGEMS